MICDSISKILGFNCHPLSADGSVAMIDSPFSFPDGDDFPIFVEKIGPQLRFFDDGATIIHFLGLGINLDNHRKTRFIKSISEPYGVALNNTGELEIWSTEVCAPKAFAKFISTMIELAKWESDQLGVATDISYFLDEVALCLRAWKPGALFSESPEFRGISGHKYKLDFSIGGDAVLAITPHHSSVGSAAKKLLDIRAVHEYSGLKILVVIDDRADKQAAISEGRVLESVSNVMLMSSLERQAQLSKIAN